MSKLKEPYHADHIQPVKLGGLSTAENLILVCSACNIRKSDKTLLEFCELQGFQFLKLWRASEFSESVSKVIEDLVEIR